VTLPDASRVVTQVQPAAAAGEYVVNSTREHRRRDTTTRTTRGWVAAVRKGVMKVQRIPGENKK